VNLQDHDQWSALHFAAQHNSEALSRVLLDHGAVVDIQDAHGNTPLGRATFNSRDRGEVIGLLLAHGANKDKNHHGVSPLGLAQVVANYDIARFFS
jgi:ankyrin repeat protein